MKINLLAALAAVLFGVSYAAADEMAAVLLLGNELRTATPDETPISLIGRNGGGRGWTAGVEATYLTPVFEAGDAFDTENNTVELDYDFEAAPRVWFGVENCNGVGVRARYWEFDAEAGFGEFDINPTALEVEGVYSTSHLETYTIDLEGTKRFCRGSWDLLASVGVRHAHIGYENATTEIEYVDDDGIEIHTQSVLLSREFDGTGITFAAEGSRPFGCSGWGLYWNARGSVLWGDNKAAAAGFEGESDGGGEVEINLEDQRDRDTLFIGEIQVGAEWKRSLKCVRADIFARAVFEAQWWNLGNHDPLQVGDDFDADLDALGSGDVALYGAACSIGISR